ncbi:MerC domain-containing protein [Cnuella takakiae]|nr:MerC domain-containing protein [Cnuella takakiae]OLY92317.1 hypothetical protein BUE76_10725 [Cnuella takakiae]
MNMSAGNEYRGRMDLVSMAISVICLVHCVALPLLMAILPVVGIASGEWPLLEWSTVLLTAGIGGYAIWKGYTQVHQQKSIVAAFVAGFFLVALANLLAIDAVEMVLKGVGAVLLIWAHLRNRAESRRCCPIPVVQKTGSPEMV